MSSVLAMHDSCIQILTDTKSDESVLDQLISALLADLRQHTTHAASPPTRSLGANQLFRNCQVSADACDESRIIDTPPPVRPSRDLRFAMHTHLRFLQSHQEILQHI